MLFILPNKIHIYVRCWHWVWSAVVSCCCQYFISAGCIRKIYKEKRAKPNLYYVRFVRVKIRRLTNLEREACLVTNTDNATLSGLNVQLRKVYNTYYRARCTSNLCVINTRHILLSTQCRCFFTDKLSVTPSCPVWGQLPSHASILPHELPRDINYLKKPQITATFRKVLFIKVLKDGTPTALATWVGKDLEGEGHHFFSLV